MDIYDKGTRESCGRVVFILHFAIGINVVADDSHEMIYKNISSKNDDVLMLNQNMLKLKSIG